MHSLRFKSIAPFLLGALILTLCLSWYTYTSARYAVSDAAHILAQSQTRKTVNTIYQYLTSISGTLEKMASDYHITMLFNGQGTRHNSTSLVTVNDSIQKWLDVMVQGNEFLRNIFIVNSEGVCIAANSSLQVGVSYANRPYVNKALQGTAAFGDLNVGRITRNFSAAAATPININGRIVGAVAAINDFPQIVSYDGITDSDIRALFTAFLTPDGNFVSHKDQKFVTRNSRNYTALYELLADGGQEGGMVEYELDGQTYIGYAEVAPVSKWLVVTSGVESEVYASAYKIGQVVFVISLIILCCISFVVVRISNGMMNSLFSLINYAKQVSEGHVDLKLGPSTRKDELGVLHNALESLVQSLQKMLETSQEASKLKSQFLANMSHEIRTPLNAIVGMTYLSLADSSLSITEHGYLEKIQVAAKSLLGIINNILDISKIEAGMFELDATPFDLRGTINNIIIIHQEVAHAKNIDLVMKYMPDTPQHFIGDPLRIGQVINNLVGNAIKFTEYGGVTIRCSLVDEGALSEDDVKIMINVSDSGIGIASEVVGLLFQPFTQADASITRKFGGTGLGLAISDKIVRMMCGTFVVESTPNMGTTFSFTMELKKDKAPTSVITQNISFREALENLDLQGKTILIAEDNQVNQYIMKKFLLPTKAEILLVENGQQAVDTASDRHLDLIFMDVQMPVMDGIQATKEIRKLADHDRLPIIAVTANAMKEDKDEAFASGLNDYITKPVEPFQIIAMLEKWLLFDKRN